jgi:hypothetical protein
MIEKFFTQSQTLIRMRRAFWVRTSQRSPQPLIKYTIRPLPFACICGQPTTSGCGFKTRTSESPISATSPSTATSGDWTDNAPRPLPMAGQNAHRFKADDTLLRFLSTL